MAHETDRAWCVAGVGIAKRVAYGLNFSKDFGRVVSDRASGKPAARAGAESRWTGGIFVEDFGSDQGADDSAVAAPDGGISARVVKKKRTLVIEGHRTQAAVAIEVDHSAKEVSATP